jgi:dephospho-CoA kinase
VGGIGSGKSFVASLFRELGAEVVDADLIVRRLLRTQEVRSAYVRAWGPGILDALGRIDAGEVSRRVFGRPREVRRLNRIMHPFVKREMRRRLQGARGPVVIDAPLLLETGTDCFCDAIVFVDAPRTQRLRRVMRTRGWSAEDLSRREAAQWPVSKKRRAADFRLRNAGPSAEVRRRAAKLWAKIVKAGA